MSTIKLNHLVSSPRGKIVKEAQNSHGKKDTVFGRDISESTHKLNLKGYAKKMSLKKDKNS